MEAYSSSLAALFIYLPAAAIVISNILTGNIRRKARHYIVACVSGLQALLSAYYFVWMLLNDQEILPFHLLPSSAETAGSYFALNRVGLVIMFCEGIVCMASVLVASDTIRVKTNSYTNLLMILLLAMTAITVSRNLFTVYLYMEIVGIASFIMIAIYREDLSLEGAFKYLTMSCLAGAFILSGCAFIFMTEGTLQFEELSALSLDMAAGKVSTSSYILLFAAAALLFSGFCIKAGAAPFHNWLPDAYQSADASVSIVLSGVINKAAGVYGIIKVAEIFRSMPGIHEALAVVGLFSVAVGALLALRQDNFKRVAAYSSVSQIGYVILGVAAGTSLGLIGAAAHIFSHAMFKSTLFANSAALREQTGTLDMDEMGGLENQMPITSVTSVIAFLSTAGIPPFAGFWSKFTIILALFLGGMRGTAVIALLLSVLTGAYYLRLQRKVFFGKPLEKFAGIKEERGGIMTAELMLTVLTVAGGLAYPFLLKLLGLG